jgi:outer membrane lipoprotein-sorting protein
MMRKLILVLSGLILAFNLNSQSLDEIIKKYSAAMKLDKLASVTSIKISGKMSAMGMSLPMEMYMKNPNKIKVVYSFNGQEMISVFDGEKGYTMNPMTGGSTPVELTGDQLEQVKKSSAFKNELLTYYKEGKVTLEGEEQVNGKPAFKVKANVGTTPAYMFIDKGTYQIVKTSTTVQQMGQTMSVDSYMTDYFETQGVIMPRKTTAMASGVEAGGITIDKVEVNIPIEDSVFKLK